MFARFVPTTLSAFVVSAPFVASSTAETRKWADRTGKFTIDAEMVELKDDSVVLKKADGSLKTVPLAKLSDADRKHVESLKNTAAKPAPTAESRKYLSIPNAMLTSPWKDSNSPFDVLKFLEVPPQDENAAPLYLEAFCEFHDMHDEYFSKEELKRRRDDFRQRGDQLLQFYDQWDKDPKSVDFNAVAAWVAKYDLGFKKLAEAQQRKLCVFQIGRTFASLNYHHFASSESKMVLSWRSRCDLQRGELERPIESIKSSLRLSRDLRRRGDFLCQTVANNLERWLLDKVREILAAPTVTAEHCDRLLALLHEHEAEPLHNAYLDAVRGEYIVERDALQSLVYRTGSFSHKFLKEELKISGDVNSAASCLKLLVQLRDLRRNAFAKSASQALPKALLPSAWTGGRMLSDEDFAKEVDALNRFYASIFGVLSDPAFRRIRELEAAVTPACKPLESTALAAVFVIGPENLSDQLVRFRNTEAVTRGIQCLVAARRWQLKNSGAFSDLSTMVTAAGMSELPRDPFTNEPMKMILTDGTPVVYSVGPDETDDQGRVEWSGDIKKPGDILVRLAANSPK